MGQVDVTFQFDIKMRFRIAIWSFLFHTFSFTAYIYCPFKKILGAMIYT